MLKFITITGADETVQPGQLAQLSKVFPFVEWGILLSETRYGTPRFPSKEWLFQLGEEQPNMNLSLHLCGRYVRSLLKGHAVFLGDLEGINRDVDMWRLFKRVQINTHAEAHDWHPEALAAFIESNPDHEFIFQLDGNGVNEAMAKGMVLRFNLKNVSFLFDTSHGAGIFRGVWPVPQIAVHNPGFGYAGGLGPDNIGLALHNIREIVKKREDWNGHYWIDMETKVRGGQGGIDFFDLEKVRAILEKSQPWFPNYAAAGLVESLTTKAAPSHIASPIKPQPWLGNDDYKKSWVKEAVDHAQPELIKGDWGCSDVPAKQSTTCEDIPNRIEKIKVEVGDLPKIGIEFTELVAEFHRKFKHPVVDKPGIPDAVRCNLRFNVLEEELREFKEAFEAGDIVAVADALVDLQYVLSGAVLEFGLKDKFRALFNEVHRSNMSKACQTEEEAEATLNKALDATGEQHHAVQEPDGTWLVYRTRDMKTIKSINYSPADLFGILHEEQSQAQV